MILTGPRMSAIKRAVLLHLMFREGWVEDCSRCWDVCGKSCNTDGRGL